MYTAEYYQQRMQHRKEDFFMKAHVDRRGCIACGLCVATCPEVFQFEDGLSSVIVDEIPEYCLDDAQEAEENCPVSVISVFE